LLCFHYVPIYVMIYVYYVLLGDVCVCIFYIK
jgi:hypothetical protein